MAAVFIPLTFIWTEFAELSQVRPDFLTFVGMSSVVPTTEVGKQLLHLYDRSPR